MSLRSSLCVARASVRANVVPMLALWLLAGALIASYAWLPVVSTALAPVERFQREYGILAGFASQFVFCGMIPCFFRLTVTEVRTDRPFLKSLLQSVWCGCWGVIYVGFYALQSRMFGSDSGFPTLLAKTAFDQFVWSPLLPVPATAFFCLWMEDDFSLRRVVAVFRTDFVGRVWLANLLPNWCIWIPAVLTIYAFPPMLQVPILGFVGSFWALVSLRLAKEIAK